MSHPLRTGFSKLLIASYVIDWIMIILIAGVGAVFHTISPNKRPFSLTNPEISYPHVNHETVSIVTVGLAAFGGPAAIIFLVCLFLVPGPTVSSTTPQLLIWKRKLWEWHTGWLGLALSSASAFLITNGLKNLIGKPRPDLISRCQPDIDNISDYSYSVFATGTVFESFNVVSAEICTQTDHSLLDDGFRSFPSGHSSFAAGGLIYLSLFLASKLAITLPFLASSSDATRLSAFPSRLYKRAAEERSRGSRDNSSDSLDEPSGHDDEIIAARNEAAGPPVYLLVIAVIPFFASIYVAATRYSDFRHHGFDILFGYLIGTVCALFSFRYYHLPINQGAGWSWGPRSRDRAFWAGVGVGNYAGSRELKRPQVTKHSSTDLETGRGLPRNVTNDVGTGQTKYGVSR
ncbi:PAP2 superfamily protein [Diplocarpon rosae]|nr:PAP2 superfamily protein [Diplocarpon rosae]